MNIFISLYLTFFSILFLTLLGSFSLLGLKTLIEPHWIKPLIPTLKRLLDLVYTGIILSLGLLLIVNPYLEASRIIEPDAKFRQIYLSSTFFIGRTVFYWLIWYALSRQLKQERFKNGALTLILVLFTGSFAIFDWIMFFQLGWYSTIFGLSLLLTALLLAFNICIFVQLKPKAKKPSTAALLDWNTLQLTFIGVWTYLHLMQWITIWSANLPKETGFYLIRSHGFWFLLLILITVFQCIFPIFLLLFRKLKKSILFSFILSINTLVLQFIFLYLIFGPAILGGNS